MAIIAEKVYPAGSYLWLDENFTLHLVKRIKCETIRAETSLDEFSANFLIVHDEWKDFRPSVKGRIDVHIVLHD